MIKYETLTWDQIGCLSDQITIIPVGSIEQHSLHLPLNVDSILAEEIGEILANKINAIVTPTVMYGANSLSNSGGGNSFPGSVGLSGSLLIEYYKQIFNQYISNGAKRIFVLNAHWENERFLIEAAEELGSDNTIHIIISSWWNVLSKDDMLSIFPSFTSWELEHAGQAETALMLFLKPGLVKAFDSRIRELNINYNIYSSRTNPIIQQNQGALSSYQHVDKDMGEKLFGLVVNKIIQMLRAEKIYE